MEAKSRTLEEGGGEDWYQSRWHFSEIQLGMPFLTTKEWQNFGRVESRTSWLETKKIQIKLVMTCNKNEQQQDDKNIVEL
jgi:hypothetical protein